jgi:hypothetical protein
MSGRTWMHFDFSLIVVVLLTGVIAYALHTHQESARLRQQELIERDKAEKEAQLLRDKEERKAHNEYLRQQKISDELLRQELVERERMERERESKMIFEQIKKQELLEREKSQLANEADQVRNLQLQTKTIEALKTQIVESEKTVRQATDALPEADNEIKRYILLVRSRQQDRLDAEAKLNLLSRMNPRPSNFAASADKWYKLITAASNSVAEAEQLLRNAQIKQQTLLRQQEQARANIERTQRRIDDMIARLTPPVAPAPQNEPVAAPAR